MTKRTAKLSYLQSFALSTLTLTPGRKRFRVSTLAILGVHRGTLKALERRNLIVMARFLGETAYRATEKGEAKALQDLNAKRAATR